MICTIIERKLFQTPNYNFSFQKTPKILYFSGLSDDMEGIVGNGCWIRPPGDTFLLGNVGHPSLPTGLVVLLRLLPVVTDTPTQIPTGIHPRFLQNRGFLYLLFRSWNYTKRSRPPCLHPLCCAFKHRQCLHFQPR